MWGRILFRDMSATDANEISALVRQVFDEFQAPGFLPEGIAEFYRYIAPQAIAERLENGHVFMLAENSNGTIGMIEMKRLCHISLFFVDSRFRGCGVGKTLFTRALTECRRLQPELTALTVNSSPFARPIYERLGFVPSQTEQALHGIRFIPMVMSLKPTFCNP